MRGTRSKNVAPRMVCDHTRAARPRSSQRHPHGTRRTSLCAARGEDVDSRLDEDQSRKTSRKRPANARQQHVLSSHTQAMAGSAPVSRTGALQTTVCMSSVAVPTVPVPVPAAASTTRVAMGAWVVRTAGGGCRRSACTRAGSVLPAGFEDKSVAPLSRNGLPTCPRQGLECTRALSHAFVEGAENLRAARQSSRDRSLSSAQMGCAQRAPTCLVRKNQRVRAEPSAECSSPSTGSLDWPQGARRASHRPFKAMTRNPTSTAYPYFPLTWEA